MADAKPPGKGFRLGEILVQKGYITWEQLEDALNSQAETGEAKEVTSFKPKPPGKVLNLGEILVKHGWITWDQLAKTLEIQRSSGRRLGDILLDEKFINKKDLFRGVAIQSDMTFVDFDKISIPQEVVNLVSKRIALDYKVMPLVKRGSELLIATADGRNSKLDPALLPHFQLHLVLATPEDIEKAHKQYYP
jgi:hypothetical protein